MTRLNESQVSSLTPLHGSAKTDKKKNKKKNQTEKFGICTTKEFIN